MKTTKRKNRWIAALWLALFSTWGFLLTGLLSPFLGSPGILQAIRLDHLLGIKQGQIQGLQVDLKRLDLEAFQLEKNPHVLKREIRKSLGYAAPDEIIFDFTPSEP